MSDLEDNNRTQLWLDAQARSKALSEQTTAHYNEVNAAKPGGTWTNGVYEGPNGSPIFSGSVTPGSYVSNGNPP